MQTYLSENIGERFVEPQTADLGAIYKDSSPFTPIVFVLSIGTDPAAELYKFAEKLKMGKKLHTISLGQGQGPRAELMMKSSVDTGNWVFFQVTFDVFTGSAKVRLVSNPGPVHSAFSSYCLIYFVIHSTL